MVYTFVLVFIFCLAMIECLQNCHKNTNYVKSVLIIGIVIDCSTRMYAPISFKTMFGIQCKANAFLMREKNMCVVNLINV